MEAAILARTLEELAAHGIEGLSVDRIAQAAALNKTSVYRRYPTREQLVAAALEHVLDDLEVQAVDTGSLRGDLRALATAVSAFLHQPAGRALTRAALSSDVAPHLAALAARRLEQSAAGPAHALVTRAIERGEWRSDLDPIMFFGALTGALMHRVFLENSAVDEGWLDGLLVLLVGGARPPDAAAVERG